MIFFFKEIKSTRKTSAKRKSKEIVHITVAMYARRVGEEEELTNYERCPQCLSHFF